MEPEGNSGETEKSLTDASIVFHYIKSNSFRVIHADGALGGHTPKGNYIQMALYSERTPIPLQTTHKITPEGRLGETTSTTQRSGVVREVEVEIHMNLEDAEGLATWLNKTIDELKRKMAE